MGTVVAVETDGGVAIAGDTRVTRDDAGAGDGTVVGDRADRVFDLGDAGAGAVGAPGDVDAFGRRLESALRDRELEEGAAVDLRWLARAAAEVAASTGVDAVVAARDDDGVARVRRVGPDGSVLEGPVVALGTGAPVALGRLEDADLDCDRAGAAELARDAVETAVARDAESGGEVEVWALDRGDDAASPGE